MLGVGSTLLTLQNRTTKLEVELQTVPEQLNSNWYSQDTAASAKPESRSVDTTAARVDIPAAAGWKPQGSGDAQKAGGYRDGILELRANLAGGDSYAELFLDLRAVRLAGIPQNPDGSYNLSGAELVAHVAADSDFKGDPAHPNGVQFLITK